MGGTTKNNNKEKKMSVISIKQLLEAGVQFGHPTRQWNPKMGRYIFVARNDTHIIDLEQTVVLAEAAYNYVCEMVKQGKNVLFVGTKKQATEAIKQEAERCGMFYVNSRWLGGTLTNFKTIRSRIDRLNKLNQMEKTGEFEFFPKKEVIQMRAERDKLHRNLFGIKDMNGVPGLMFIVDLKKEHIAVKEARSLGIPIVALVDTNCDPELVDVVIPGNDDAIRSVKLIASLIADAVLEAKTGESVIKAEKEEAAAVEAGDGEHETKRIFKKTEKTVAAETAAVEVPEVVEVKAEKPVKTEVAKVRAEPKVKAEPKETTEKPAKVEKKEEAEKPVKIEKKAKVEKTEVAKPVKVEKKEPVKAEKKVPAKPANTEKKEVAKPVKTEKKAPAEKKPATKKETK